MQNLQRAAGTSVHANDGHGVPLCPTGKARSSRKRMNTVDLPVDCGMCIIAVSNQHKDDAPTINTGDTLKDMLGDVVSERSSTYELFVGIGAQGFTVTTEADDYVSAVEKVRKQISITIKETTTVTRVVEL